MCSLQFKYLNENDTHMHTHTEKKNSKIKVVENICAIFNTCSNKFIRALQSGFGERNRVSTNVRKWPALKPRRS